MSHLTRRTFVGTSLSAGFALAVTPVSAETLTTDSTGIEAGEVQIPVSDGTIPGYRAMPAKGTKLPIVLVVHEIFGVHEHIRDVCRRFAKAGYLAIAPDLYARQGDASKIPEIKAIVEQIVAKVPDAQVMKDLDATAAWAAASAKGDAARTFVTGFCWGGRITWLYAAHAPKVRAGAAWYGRLVGPPHELRPKQPLDVASKLEVPVLGLYGGEDEGIPMSSIDAMRSALPWPKNASEIVVYPGAPHGFYADYRATYRKEAADEAWKRTLAWFKRFGGV